MGHPTADQLTALTAYKTKYGRQWKTKLLTAWLYGTDCKEPAGHLLRQVRNQLGPQWLEGASV